MGMIAEKTEETRAETVGTIGGMMSESMTGKMKAGMIEGMMTGEEMTHEGMKEEGIVVATGREERRTTSAARNVTLKMMLRESRTGKNGTRREQPKKRNAERRNANYRRSVTNVAEKKIKDVEKKMMK